MEPILAIVGFLGAGKTTLLKALTAQFLDAQFEPFIILNDYENADLDAQQLAEKINPNLVKPLSGSCICCSGIGELRDSVNRIPNRERGITLIEANGTTDACSLMGFLGVGIEERFLPPVQISVVDVNNWQNRGDNNELEANQIQVSSVVVLTHLDKVSDERKEAVIASIKQFNAAAQILTVDQLTPTLFSDLAPSTNTPSPLPHHKAHWSSCSVDLPKLSDYLCVQEICDGIPSRVLRIKGCTEIVGEPGFTYFERTADGEVYVRPYNGIPVTGPKLLTVGPGSDPEYLRELIAQSVKAGAFRLQKKAQV